MQIARKGFRRAVTKDIRPSDRVRQASDGDDLTLLDLRLEGGGFNLIAKCGRLDPRLEMQAYPVRGDRDESADSGAL